VLFHVVLPSPRAGLRRCLVGEAGTMSSVRVQDGGRSPGALPGPAGGVGIATRRPGPLGTQSRPVPGTAPSLKPVRALRAQAGPDTRRLLVRDFGRQRRERRAAPTTFRGGHVVCESYRERISANYVVATPDGIDRSQADGGH
jgi:hypothetical protein